MRKFCLFLLIVFAHTSFSQTQAIDSIRKLLVNNTIDTNHVINLNEIAWQFLDYSSDSSNKYVQQALKEAQDLQFLNGEIDAKNTMGILYRYAGESDKAVKLYEEILQLRLKQGRYDKLVGVYSNLGSVYYDKGDNANALIYYLKARDYAGRYLQPENEMMLLNNIGNAYKDAGLYDNAIDAFQTALKINQKVNDEVQQAYLLANIATVYDDQMLTPQAYDYTKQAHELFKKINHTRGLSTTLNNLSLYSRRLERYKETDAFLKEMKELADVMKENSYYVQYYQASANYYNDTKRLVDGIAAIDKGIALGDSTQDGAMFATSFTIKATLLFNLSKYDAALQLYNRAINCLRAINDKLHLPHAYKGKAEVLAKLGKSAQALELYKQADQMLDSLSSDSYNAKVATLNSINQLDKKEKELQLSIKEKESAETKSKQQSQFLAAAIVIALLVLILLVFSVRAYAAKKKDNALLNAQKQEIEQKNEILNTQKQEIEHQMVLIEEKQKEILDSIHYAKRIQRALLAGKELIDNNLPENFILFKPKDIVSGDFYWMAERDDKFYLAVCDSTGHGVPGAFMSLLNISFLNEAVNEKNIQAPNEVLDHVRNRLIQNLSQDGAKDGMDAILICYDKTTSQLTYAAANNKPVLINANGMQEFPADKMPVGLGESTKPFELHSIQVKKGDALYLYSDGYADQFGGPNGKKFKYKMLQAEILKHAHLPFSEQMKRLDEIFENWRGQLEQVDDVLLVGMRF